MSSRATAWAWVQIEQGLMTPATALVLLKLADRADPRSGACWPSAATTAADTGLGQRTVERCIHELKEIGLVEVEQRVDARGFRLANVYVLALGGRLEDGQMPPGEPAQKALSGPAVAALEQLKRQRSEIAAGMHS
jgi:hypothetical protein